MGEKAARDNPSFFTRVPGTRPEEMIFQNVGGFANGLPGKHCPTVEAGPHHNVQNSEKIQFHTPQAIVFILIPRTKMDY